MAGYKEEEMRPYGNEEMAWQRLLDVQREAENRRLIDAGGAAYGWSTALRPALEAWSLVRRAAGMVFVRRRPWPGPDCGEAEASTDVA
jgi:hypothetical protein